MYAEKVYQGEQTVAAKRPDLQEFLEGIRMQNDVLAKQSDQLFYYANQFRDFRREEKVSNEIQKEPVGIIEMLNYELNRMRRYNDILSQACNGFQSVIGN